MRDKLTDKIRLAHILDSINIILESKDKYEQHTIMTDPIIFFGFVKHIEIIGEAVYKLTKDFRNEHQEIEWDVIECMRHVLVHGYYTIRPEQLWTTIVDDIPKLRPVIQDLHDRL
ncbi:MAG: DUF86 domain-containing protein [Bacteroides sp.]|nr:DUF86 domain-containing protein [Bacteroides sp.]